MHQLLLSQLGRYFDGAENIDGFDETLRGFIAAVNDAYKQADQDRLLLERSMDLGSQELLERGEDLARRLPERKQAEKELERQKILFESGFHDVPDAMAFADTERNILMINPAFTRTFGYKEGDILGKNTEVLYESRDEYERQGRIHFNMAAEKKRKPYVVNYVRQDGIIFPGETVGTPIKDKDGNILGFIGVFRDISERKKAEEDRRLALLEAKQANRAKSEFLASMSHEFRTPLNAILGFAQMLQFDPKHPLSTAQNEHVESIMDGGNHLLELVNDILDLARIESDQLTLSLEEVNANEVVADSVSLTSSIGAARNVAIIDQFSSRPLSLLRTDRIRLKQALLNFLSNAIKYNKDGGTVTVDGRETEDGFLRLSVTDTGIGIPKKDHPGIFQMFQRFGTNSMVSREGTGIGLTVTKLLVERMVGRIGFESKEGAGSTFWLELPLASNEEVLIWTGALRVGVGAIDKDHQVLISLLNKASSRSIGEGGTDEVIDELIDYTHYHFRREEAIMEACGYPDQETHCGEHQSLIAQVNDLAGAWRKKRDPETLHRLRKFLRDWLVGHILNVDTGISPYVRGKDQEIRKALDSLE